MEWVQAADDFIKIGLPSICTAAVALLGAKRRSGVLGVGLYAC